MCLATRASRGGAGQRERLGGDGRQRLRECAGPVTGAPRVAVDGRRPATWRSAIVRLYRVGRDVAATVGCAPRTRPRTDSNCSATRLTPPRRPGASRAVRRGRLPRPRPRPRRSSGRLGARALPCRAGPGEREERIGGPRCSTPTSSTTPSSRPLALAARAVIAERVRRGIATPDERLVVAALDEMPDENDPAAVRAWTLELYVGIVEALADQADQAAAAGGGEDDALITVVRLRLHPTGASEVLRHSPPLGRRPGRVSAPPSERSFSSRPASRRSSTRPGSSAPSPAPHGPSGRSPARRRPHGPPPGTAAPPSAARAARPGPRAPGPRRTATNIPAAAATSAHRRTLTSLRRIPAMKERPRSTTTSSDSTPRPLAALTGGPPVSPRGPGPFVPRQGSARRRGGARKRAAATAVDALDEALPCSWSSASRPGSRPRAPGRRSPQLEQRRKPPKFGTPHGAGA